MENYFIKITKRNFQAGYNCSTNLDFFNEAIVFYNDRINSSLIFRKPILSDLKKVETHRKFNLWTFFMNTVEVETGLYTDIEIKDETLTLYYK